MDIFQLSESCRAQLLTMSAATADRLLASQRCVSQRGLSTTRRGTLLKQQIPIRTSQQWNETKPGFLEADLVAHCGPSLQGTFLYTLTLTDIATGWTECFPLRSKSQQEVLAALSQVRGLFPFPILGLDTDSGSEFINLALFNYCQQHQLTFTRSRPSFKNDQCFVEQKNGNIVRQVTGYNRMMGHPAYTQLGELYQALRLYVNVFQPSMKLIGKLQEGKKVHRIYDAAKTPLQRVLLSEVLPVAKKQELERMVRLLDPLRLFEHLQVLQQALFAQFQEVSPEASRGLSFCLERCIASSHAPVDETRKQARNPQGSPFLTSDSTSKDEPEKVFCISRVTKTVKNGAARSPFSQETGERTLPTSCKSTGGDLLMSSTEFSGAPPLSTQQRPGVRKALSVLSIEQAIESYLEYEQSLHRRPKTLEWHPHALRLFQSYMLTEHAGGMIGQITEERIRDWFTFLRSAPTARGHLRSASTVQTYARSVRAFCQWMVQKKYLSTSPFASLSLPEEEHRLPEILPSEEWDCLLLACDLYLASGERAEQAAARNRAILWLLFDTGMHVAELCRLQIRDVDQEQGILTLRGNGSKTRQLTLGQQGRCALLAYLDRYRLADGAACGEQERRSAEPLFLSETAHPLTEEAVALVFGRLRERAGIRGGITPSMLRETFAVRYLQTGGEPEALREILGIKERAAITRYERLLDQLCENQS